MKVRHILIMLIFPLHLYAGQIFINQEGYLPNLIKKFYTNTYSDSFFVIEKSSGLTFFSGTLTFKTSNDPATGLQIYYGDFTSLTRTGEYFLKTSNGDTSFTFKISNSVYHDAFYKSLKGFYFQRCGTALLTLNAGIYNRLKCHNADGFFHPSSGNSGYLANTGGWHDAGDFGKYVVNAGITVGTLLMALELYPQIFSPDDLNIPESNNGIPDILDEVKYELDWLLKMQSSNGGVYFKLTKEQFEGFIMPSQDSGTRYVYTLSTTATGNFAAVMARAYRLFSLYDTSYANKCLNAAKSAFVYLTQNTSIVPAGGFRNPSGTATGEYGDTDDKDERLWAAAELFESTGAASYNTYYLSHYNEASLISAMNWNNVRCMANLTYLFGKTTGSSQYTKDAIKTSLISFCNNLLSAANADGFNVTINQYSWGSNSDVLNRAIILLLGYKLINTENYLRTALDQFNYTLGTNAHNMSFITGVGDKSVMFPHHRPSGADNIINPVPGLIAGGPDEYLNDPVLQQHYNTNTPPALCYIDDQGSYASNEICINWNAPLVFVAGFFNKYDITSINEKKDETLNYKIHLEQNYPNPFNNTTIIKFNLAERSYVNFSIYNINGEEVFNKNYNELSAGENTIAWNGVDNYGKSISSGVYLCRVEGAGSFDTKKIVLMK
ncbi:MAG: glycoside hydrolase family 9 protein [Syntrophothermus sp.]